ncbi:MAG: HlyD family efflux transporter periplasmic adaptor subunit [Terrisporobacter sp.]|uniref:efflux RND transporter periplasmic adaptor subunit n=1 Tax=Terrisporobacter sp. TaxID=1965305 RepID=UPI002FC6978E
MSFKLNFKSKKVRIGMIIAVIVVLGVGFNIYKNFKMNDVELEGMSEGIETYSIPDNEKIFINGAITPKESKDLSLEAGYEIYSLNVSNGQSVTKGEAIFTAKSSENVSQIKELEQQISDLKNGSQSDEESSDTSINSEIAKINSDIKKLKNKSYITVYAPFSGKVYMNEDKTSEEEIPSYMTIESNEYYMKGQVSEQDLPKLRKSLPVNVYVFATEEKLTGRISSISERPTSGGAEVEGEMTGSSLSYYDVCVEFDNQEKLTNGFHIQASVEVKNKNPKVPASALKKDKNGYFVYKVVGGRLSKQSVEVENQTEDFAVLRSGLVQKDVIVTVPTDEMKEGDEVPVDSMGMEESSEEKVGM